MFINIQYIIIIKSEKVWRDACFFNAFDGLIFTIHKCLPENCICFFKILVPRSHIVSSNPAHLRNHVPGYGGHVRKLPAEYTRRELSEPDVRGVLQGRPGLPSAQSKP